jgi:hypothetical protein
MLQTFGLPRLDDHATITDSLAFIIPGLNDTDLLEMYAVVAGEKWVDANFEHQVDETTWPGGYVRAFIPHASSQQEHAQSISQDLRAIGVTGFVAHTEVRVTKPWREQIENALRTADVFIGLCDQDFLASTWCQQEVGWALGRSLPTLILRLAGAPQGFLAHTQWPAGTSGKGTSTSISHITQWIMNQEQFGSSLAEGLFARLADAANYFDAEAAAKRIDALGELSDKQFARLDEVFHANNQVGNSVLATRALRPLYERNGRVFPPPRPDVV